jgi:hypothetical protein
MLNAIANQRVEARQCVIQLKLQCDCTLALVIYVLYCREKGGDARTLLAITLSVSFPTILPV